jgi:hypothetical protein
MSRKTVEERFWEKVDKSAGPDGCWPWMAGTDRGGYGQFKVSGRMVGAHCVAYGLTKGPIAAGLDVLHDCDNRPCCNPSHLWPGTHTDNMQDAASKGRTARGERNGTHTHPERVARGERRNTAKLTETQVREVRWLSAAGNTHREIARLMGVSDSNIGRIVRGKTWGHLLPIEGGAR